MAKKEQSQLDNYAVLLHGKRYSALNDNQAAEVQDLLLDQAAAAQYEAEQAGQHMRKCSMKTI